MIFWGALTLFVGAICYGFGVDAGKASRPRPAPRKRPVLRETDEGVPILEWRDL